MEQNEMILVEEEFFVTAKKYGVISMQDCTKFINSSVEHLDGLMYVAIPKKDYKAWYIKVECAYMQEQSPKKLRFFTHEIE